MRFALSAEHHEFAASLDALLTDTDTATANRAWARGDHGPGLRLWHSLAETGVPALSVPERFDGLGATAVDAVVAFERLGYHAVPGPWVDTAAVLPALLAGDGADTADDADDADDAGSGTAA
ncbi:acyl-CoA dehydrogenase family protein, partial [Saccharomonospora halophila]|uniref:acyl-CoA dehydrogenase family protein n=1 Tax=Saccharomonospora halophila TaxID=129922 RepID=UPI00036975B5